MPDGADDSFRFFSNENNSQIVTEKMNYSNKQQ